jgi:hypothetical protein
MFVGTARLYMKDSDVRELIEVELKNLHITVDEIDKAAGKFKQK